MQTFMGPPAPGKKSRSLLARERLQSLWFSMVSRLLRLTMGPLNLKMPLLDAPAACAHPMEHRASGANQYGRWERCNLCRQKLNFDRYSAENPKTPAKSAKASIQDTQVATKVKKAAGYVAKAMETPKAVELVTQQEMQGMMQQLLQGQLELQGQMAHLMRTQATLSGAPPMMMPGVASVSGAFHQMPVFPPQAPFQVDLAQDDEEMDNPNEWDRVLPSQ